MVATLTNERIWKTRNIDGEQYTIYATFKVTFDSAYVAGGEAVDLSTYFGSAFHVAATQAEDGTSGGYVPAVTDSNFVSPSAVNIELFCQSSNQTMAALNEVTAGRQLQSVVTRLFVVGK